MPSPISFSGLGSGLDINSLVQQLVAAERAPTERQINVAGTAANAKLSAVGTISSSLGNLQTALEALSRSADTPAYTATAATGAGFTATAGSTASPGSYSVEVVSLAQRQKLASAGFSADATFGAGSLSITYGSDSIEVAVAAGSTLAQVAATVNQTAGDKGVTAAVVTADDGQHLVFNAVDAGTAGALAISASSGLEAFATGAGGMDAVVAATDAVVRVDGFERTASSNSIGDLIPGVTLNLTQATAGSTYTLTVAEDGSGLKTNLQAFVAAYNAANAVLRSASAYNAETRTASALTGDAMVRGLQQQLRSTIGANAGEFRTLGISIAVDGTLNLDAARFDAARAADPALAAGVFGEEGSLSGRLASLLDSQLDSDTGTLSLRSDSLNDQIDGLSGQLDALDRRMAAVEARYLAQFTAMDSLVAQMQSTSSFLGQQLASLQTSTQGS